MVMTLVNALLTFCTSFPETAPIAIPKIEREINHGKHR